MEEYSKRNALSLNKGASQKNCSYIEKEISRQIKREPKRKVIYYRTKIGLREKKLGSKALD